MRLTFRPLVEADAEALLELRAWMRAGDLEAVRARLRGWESRTSPDGAERWLNWLVCDDDEPAAWMQATVRAGSAEVAYAVLPRRRRQGIAAEAITAVTAWLHEEAGVAVVEAHIADDNRGSQAAARRAGFTRTARTQGGEAVWEHVA